MRIKQIDISNYNFDTYILKERWMSMWHQLNEVLSLNPKKVLEIGTGVGIFKTLIKSFGIRIESVDIDPDLNPDHLASVEDLPMDSNSYDCVCAFQVLEHLPYKQSIKAFEEMVRVAKRNIIISLPDAKQIYTYSFHIPALGPKLFHIKKPRMSPPIHKFDGQHYWEINKKDYPLKRIIHDLTEKDVKLVKTYFVDEFTYHRFFIFNKTNGK